MKEALGPSKPTLRVVSQAKEHTMLQTLSRAHNENSCKTLFFFLTQHVCVVLLWGKRYRNQKQKKKGQT